MLLFIINLVTALEYLPIYGKIELEGHYYTKLSIGTPAKLKYFSIDLSSRLSFLTCSPCKNCGKHSSTYFNPKSSNSCSYPHYSTATSHKLNQSDALNYSIVFNQGSELRGYLIQETLTLSNHLNISNEFKLILGCNSKETGVFIEQPEDGILGFADIENSHLSLVNSMVKGRIIESKSFSFCFALFDGFITFGGMDIGLNSSPTVWVDMVKNRNYAFEVDEIGFGNKNYLETPTEFLLSSGSAISFFDSGIFSRLMKGLEGFCKQNGKCLGKITELEGFTGKCFHSLSISEDKFFSSFPILEFQVKDSKIFWNPESYLVRIRTEAGLFCIGISLNNDSEKNILGSNFLRLKQVNFDIDKGKIGFSDSDCELPNYISINEQLYKEVYERQDLFISDETMFMLMLIVLHVTFAVFYIKIRNSDILEENKKLVDV